MRLNSNRNHGIDATAVSADNRSGRDLFGAGAYPGPPGAAGIRGTISPQARMTVGAFTAGSQTGATACPSLRQVLPVVPRRSQPVVLPSASERVDPAAVSPGDQKFASKDASRATFPSVTTSTAFSRPEKATLKAYRGSQHVSSATRFTQAVLHHAAPHQAAPHQAAPHQAIVKVPELVQAPKRAPSFEVILI